MTLNKLALSLLVTLGAGCTTVPPVPLSANLPDCFNSNYDKERRLFTIRNATADTVNQQCRLIVSSGGGVATDSRIPAGKYRAYLSNGGGGGGGGTLQNSTGGGGGGGGAGAKDTELAVDLTAGEYRLTIGIGGAGGAGCGAGFGGGPGWTGSPSSVVRMASGEVVVGVPGAETYVRPSRAQNERNSGKQDGHGGSGPGQTSGGQGGSDSVNKAEVIATSGNSRLASGQMAVGGAAGKDPLDRNIAGEGGGGGASRQGAGGVGGGETVAGQEAPPARGLLGSGGGGGGGTASDCSAGSRGGHGYIAFRMN